MPVFGFALKRAAAVNISFFWDFVWISDSGAVNSFGRRISEDQEEE